jgi:hypothetical protein
MTEKTKSYREAQTRNNTRQLGGHFPAEHVKAFRLLAHNNDLDGQELMAEAMNLAFEHYGYPNRVNVVSRRRKRTRPSAEPGI